MPTTPHPFGPDEAAALKAAALPPVVFDVFNALIARSFDGHSATVMQEDAVKDLLGRDRSLTRTRIFAEHMLDVETVYTAWGWDVDYDKPGFNETGMASWCFTERAS